MYLGPWMTATDKLWAVQECAVNLSKLEGFGASWLESVRTRGRSGSLSMDLAAQLCAELGALDARPVVTGPYGQWVREDLDAIAAYGGDCVERSLALLTACNALGLAAYVAWLPQSGALDHMVVRVMGPHDETELDPSSGRVVRRGADTSSPSR